MSAYPDLKDNKTYSVYESCTQPSHWHFLGDKCHQCARCVKYEEMEFILCPYSRKVLTLQFPGGSHIDHPGASNPSSLYRD